MQNYNFPPKQTNISGIFFQIAKVASPIHRARPTGKGGHCKNYSKRLIKALRMKKEEYFLTRRRKLSSNDKKAFLWAEESIPILDPNFAAKTTDMRSKLFSLYETLRTSTWRGVSDQSNLRDSAVSSPVGVGSGGHSCQPHRWPLCRGGHALSRAAPCGR